MSVTDDRRGMVSFNLAAPDADFPYKLTEQAYSAPVPPATFDHAEDSTRPPGTGLPPPATPVPLQQPIHDVDNEQLTPIIPKLALLADQIGCTISWEAMNGHCHGYLDPGSWRIGIDTRLSGNGKVKTLCHELAHALIRLERQPEDPELDYAGEELVVESVAYTCVGALGIRSDQYSIPYLASWAECCELEVLERTAGLIDKLASRIETAADGRPSERQSTPTPDLAGDGITR
jgi:hypothetical protein